MIERLAAYISGDVQGVGYRAFARRYARTLGLVGYARNLADGVVEVVAEGPRELLERLLAELRRGPISADVSDVRIEWGIATGEYQTFSIRF
jgi:acylphosphatase